MKFTKLNGTDLTVSRVALGTDSIGTFIGEEQSFAILDLFSELGGNLIDTAVSYADWEPGERSRSEKLIGRWIKRRSNREDLIISTKGGCPRYETMHISRLSGEEINADINDSLKNLGTDYIDIYFLHRDDKAIEVGELVEILGGFVKSGKTRYVGVSNWSTERIDSANAYCRQHKLPELIASQLQFSPAKPNLENIESTLEVMKTADFDYYAEKKMNVFAFSAQAKGYFAKLDKNLPLTRKAHDRYENDVSREIYSELKAKSNECGADVTELTVACLASNPSFVTIPILGCKTTEQLSGSLRGADIVLEPEEARRILKMGLIVQN